MSSSSESDISTEVMAGVEASETAISSSEPVNGVSSSEGLKGGLKKVKEELKDEERPVPRLILPAKVYASHVANLKEEKPKRSPGTERPTRPTQVPPLVFPLANMFEERTPLPLSSSNNPSNFGAAASTTASDGPTHSPPFWDPSDSASRNGPVSCMMYHKIRGGKGEWREVAPWELIRVTKGVGKKVKMVVEAPGRFGPGDVHISLTDMTDQVRTPRTPGNRSSKSSRFIVESTTVGVMDPETGKSSAELIIKLFKLSKQLIFQATVSVQGGPGEANSVLRGQSSPFGTHNSGKQRRKREKEGDEDDDDDFGVPHAASSVPSSTMNHNTTAASNASNAGASGGSGYPRRRKQPKRHESEDDTWVNPSTMGHGGAAGTHHMNGNSNAGNGPSEDLLESIWPLSDEIPQKEMVAQVNNRMREFGNKELLEEARKRRAGIVVYVACRRSLHQPEDFTTFVYKAENLLKEDAVTMGTPLGRALFIPAERGDTTGVFTLVAAVRAGPQDVMFAPNSGIAAVYDFRRDGDHLMKTIPIHPVLLATEPTTVWLIGSFQVDQRSIGWLPSPAAAAAAAQQQHAHMNSAAAMAGGLMSPTAASAAAYHQQMQQHQQAAGFRGLGGMPFAGMGPIASAASLGSGPAQNGPNGSNGAVGSNNGSTGNSGQANGSNGANNPPVIPPLPLGAGTLGYPHLAVQYSPRNSLHSPTPYYGGAAAAAAAAGYLAPKPLYAPNSPAPSPSSTPIPGASANNSGGALGPPTPGLQTPRGFGDMLSPFSGQTGFYSPLSNAPYSYMFDPLLLSARGLGPEHSTGFYSPTSSATSAASSGGSTNNANSLNLSQFKGTTPQPPFNQYAYNLFPGAGGFQGSISGFPGNSPRFEELLDSGRM